MSKLQPNKSSNFDEHLRNQPQLQRNMSRDSLGMKKRNFIEYSPDIQPQGNDFDDLCRLQSRDYERISLKMIKTSTLKK